MSRVLLTSALFFALIFGAQPASAGELGVTVVFSKKEISIIASWYQDHGQSNGKRAKKQKGLPPGISKNLARGKPLPPGIAKRYLPTDLNLLLPPPPRGFERVIVDGKMLLVEIATRVVHDILTNVILH
jgi:Ni/Co efflux regulator RcnB